jgi:asparagine synthase (glutamine-hydrolysing)
MCGITGFLEPGPGETATLRRRVTAMAAQLRHRGPDDAGAWADGDAGIALAHRRLSILDLSPLGRQPMVSASGRYHIVFNGEIYNFAQLRQELRADGAEFVSGTDTEVLLAGIEHWGAERTLDRAVGMFAFAVWDSQQRLLLLARDRLGEKPLYYGWLGRHFVFASEIGAFRAHPHWKGVVRPDAVAAQMRYGYIPGPHSIYKGIYKLPPGTCLALSASRNALGPVDFSPLPDTAGASLQPWRYWSLRQAAGRSTGHAGSRSSADFVDLLEDRLRATIRDQMIADVPLGAFLSGGIDSSTVVALMQAQSSRPVRTFTIGFHDRDFNEAPHAAAIARHLGTDHTELYLDEAQVVGAVPQLAALYDEPFADASMLPTALICRLARQHVTVCLTGDGGDELFGGYNRYRWTAGVWRATGWWPAPLRRASARGLDVLRPDWVDALLEGYRRADGPARPTSPGHRLRKLAALMGAPDRVALYRTAVAYWDEPVVIAPGAPPVLPADDVFKSNRPFMEQMMLWDGLVYLPDDNLTKVDRAAMSVGLETRVPLLDHRVVELAWALPLGLKIAQGRGKWLLRQVLYRHVPPKMVERPKMGFSVPIGRWLRGPLREWAESLLAEERVRSEGILDAALVRRIWREHQEGLHNRQAQLWSVLMFQAWREASLALPKPVEEPEVPKQAAG